MAEKKEFGGMEEITGENCPFCKEKTLTLREGEKDVPFFGKIFIFSMDCSNCNYHKADIECAEKHSPVKFTIDIDSEEDMKIRVIKSSTATIKIPHVGSIEPGEAANGYITNIEGILGRMKKQVEIIRDESEEKADVKKAKNIIKKLTKVIWGRERLKITLEDPNGNSAIVSEKAVKGKL